MTKHERLFIAAYVGAAGRNATEAAIRAGYSRKTARTIGSKLLTKVDIRAAVNAKLEQLEDASGVTAERVIRELARIGFSDVRELVDDTGRLRPLHELSNDVAATIASVEVLANFSTKIKVWDKPAALQTLCRHFGILRDKVDHQHSFTLEQALDASRTDAA
jgi:phage terminase small subunit